MNAPQPQPLILTLKLDVATFERFDHLRRQHFPPERNFLLAHLTLFHALPGGPLESIQQTLQAVTQATSSFPLLFAKVRTLGRGVAADVESTELLALRRTLATGWQIWLTPQDRQGYRPHITIQNKVNTSEARHLFADLSATWQPITGYGEGLLLWRYLGGPWHLEREFPFKNTLL